MKVCRKKVGIDGGAFERRGSSLVQGWCWKVTNLIQVSGSAEAELSEERLLLECVFGAQICGVKGAFLFVHGEQ